VTGAGAPGLAVLSLLLSGVLWGTAWIPLKHFASQGLTGLTMTLCTYGLVGVVALPWIFRLRLQWLPQWRLVAGAAAFCGLANACFTTAVMFGEVARSMLLFYLVPVWGVLGGRLFLGERITRLRAAGAVLAIAGAFLVLGGPAILAQPPGLLDLAAVGAGLFYASQNICARASDRVPVLPKTLIAFVGCAVVGAALIPVARHGLPPISAGLAAGLAAFAGLWLTAAMGTQTYGVSNLEAGRAAVLVIFELLTAVASAMLISGERLDAGGWAGAALITSAALLEAFSVDPPPPADTTLPRTTRSP
jgi:drug/metabolite transporter (DMT)-like permease